MQHCELLDSPDGNFNRYAGYIQNPTMKNLFSKKNIEIISRKVTELLQGVDSEGRDIVVPNETISNVMSQIQLNTIPKNTGDIYTRYIIPAGDNFDPMWSYIINKTIETIVSDVKSNLGMEECNRKLTIWTTMLGDFNKHGLMPHSKINLNNKRHRSRNTNMNY